LCDEDQHEREEPVVLHPLLLRIWFLEEPRCQLHPVEAKTIYDHSTIHLLPQWKKSTFVNRSVLLIPWSAVQNSRRRAPAAAAVRLLNQRHNGSKSELDLPVAATLKRSQPYVWLSRFSISTASKRSVKVATTQKGQGRRSSGLGALPAIKDDENAVILVCCGSSA
jgi:hypothetical protein